VDHPDLGWLGLSREGEGRWSFELTPPLGRLDAKFYGGTGVAVATAAMEAETGRSTLWTTVQYVASADVGDRLDVRVDVLAGGHRTSQVQVTGAVGEQTVFVALGSTAHLKPAEMVAQVGEMPDAGEPGDGDEWASKLPFPIGDGRPGWLEITSMKLVELGPRRLAIWARMADRPLSRPALGFLADVVPMGLMRALGRAGGGTSLDNSIRFGAEPRGEWVLIELDPHLVAGGYGQGAAKLWATDGTLLGVASQTATIRTFD
jgi:acyl-CoA thioesterase